MKRGALSQKNNQLSLRPGTFGYLKQGLMLATVLSGDREQGLFYVHGGEEFYWHEIDGNPVFYLGVTVCDYKVEAVNASLDRGIPPDNYLQNRYNDLVRTVLGLRQPSIWRVIDQLYLLAKSPAVAPMREWLEVPITRYYIGMATGMSREMVGRALHTLESDGYVKPGRSIRYSMVPTDEDRWLTLEDCLGKYGGMSPETYQMHVNRAINLRKIKLGREYESNTDQRGNGTGSGLGVDRPREPVPSRDGARNESGVRKHTTRRVSSSRTSGFGW